MRSGEGDFGKLKFLAKFQVMRTQTFKKSTIQSAFKRTGIIPYNPEDVLNKSAHCQVRPGNYPAST